MLYVVSDIHGHYDKYLELLQKIEFSADDTLYVLGDVIDRGPDGCRILQDMMARSNVVPILGNHEFTAAVCLPWLMEEVTDQSLASLSETQIAALREWICNGGGPTLRALTQLSQTEREDLLEYLQDMDLYAEVTAGGRRFLLVHAGLDQFSRENRWRTTSFRTSCSAALIGILRSMRTAIWSMATRLPGCSSSRPVNRRRIGSFCAGPRSRWTAALLLGGGWAVFVWIRWRRFMYP